MTRQASVQGRGGDGIEAQWEQWQPTVKAAARAAMRAAEKVVASVGLHWNEGGTGFLLVAEVEVVLLVKGGWRQNEGQREQRLPTAKAAARSATESTAKVIASGNVHWNEGGTGVC